MKSQVSLEKVARTEQGMERREDALMLSLAEDGWKGLSTQGMESDSKQEGTRK